MRKTWIAILLGMALILPGCAGSKTQTQNTPPPNNNMTTQQGTTQSNLATQKVFTVEELKKYNGQNGNPAYVAVDGIVYDVTNSNLWKDGGHEGCSQAGNDLTNALGNAPHGKEKFRRMPIVGTLKK